MSKPFGVCEFKHSDDTVIRRYEDGEKCCECDSPESEAKGECTYCGREFLEAEIARLNAWKAKTCGTCRFRIERRCHEQPIVQYVATEPHATYLIVHHGGDLFTPACAQHREEGEE